MKHLYTSETPLFNCHSSGKKQFNVFLLEWEKCLRIFEPLIISVCALWALSTYTTSLCWFRERGQQTQAPGHILLCFSGFFWLSLRWLFPFSVRFLEGCEPSLTAVGFCNIDFMETVAHVLPIVPTASDTLQMLLRVLQEVVGLNRQPDLLFHHLFCWTKHLSQAQSPLCFGLPKCWGSCCAFPRPWTAARSQCSQGRLRWGRQRASGAGAWRKAGSGG